MRRWLVAVLCCAACGPAEPDRSASPIYGGIVDQADPNVAMLFYYDVTDPGHTTGFICTATVVGKRTLLTAAHCVQENVDAGKEDDGYAVFGTDENTGMQVSLAGARYHRGYTGDDGPLFPDVAVVYLAADAPADPVTLNDQILEGEVGATTVLRAVGWGDIISNGAGTKRVADDVVFRQLGERDRFTLGNAQAGICFGDSGGPLFTMIGGVEKQVGIVSYGTEVCGIGGDTAVRVDSYLRTFVLPALDAFEGPCKVDGVCVTTGCRTEDPDCNGCGPDPAGLCNPDCELPDWDCPVPAGNGVPCVDRFDCDSRICVEAKDDPRLHFCSDECIPSRPLACATAQTCDLVDGRNICRFKTPSPGALGSSCTAGSTCRSGLCHPTANVCLEPCDPEQANACPTGYECMASSLAPFVCAPPGLAEGGGGCCAVGTGSPASPMALLLLVLAALSRRRR